MVPMMGILRHGHRLLRSGLALLLITLLVIPAAAQPTPQQEAQARDLTKRAIAKSSAGNHVGAVEDYLEAYKLVPNAMLLSNIGAEYAQMKDRRADAKKYFCMYLKEDPGGPNASYALNQAKLLAELLGQKDVDDKTACQDPKPEPVKPPPDDTTTTGTTDIGVAKSAEPADPGKPLKIAGLVSMTLGAAGLGVGMYFGLEAKRISDEITNHDTSMPWDSDIEKMEADGQAAENKQIAFMIGGGVLVATGAVLFVIGRSKSSSETVIAPTAGADGSMGMVVSGRF
jgi:hypothetical protein